MIRNLNVNGPLQGMAHDCHVEDYRLAVELILILAPILKEFPIDGIDISVNLYENLIESVINGKNGVSLSC